MSITKQILFIARPLKSSALAQQLYIFSQECLKLSGCSMSEIYSCDDDSNEFMLFMQWNNQESYNEFEYKQLKQFESDNKTTLLKREILRLD